MTHDRREFTRGMAAAGVATALGGARRAGASERIGIGIIGCGNKGEALWKNFLAQPEVEPVAVADVYQPFRDRGVTMSGGRARPYADFRKLLDDKNVQAVVVAVPDHWHALMTVMACRAGKDVYVEKPLSLMVSEGRVMVNEARRHKRVVQVGSQQRSGAHYARAVQLIRSGHIGEVHQISVGFTRNVLPGFKPKDLPVSESNLDWDMWLGPAPKVPFDPFRCLYNFRWFWDYSGGQMTNFGAHHLDIARWALGAEAPTAVAGFGSRFAIKDGGQTPDVQEVVYQFPGCVVTWTAREINKGERGHDIEFHGTKGTLGISRSGFKLTPEGADKAAPALEEKGSEMDRTHIANFLACVKSRARPNADVEEGHRSATMCHLGNIATRLGRSLRWDAAKETIIADPEATHWLTRPYRHPWSLANV
jgi:myo-inositol 2-dehydrogenase / D-chiro-inositol 1-dehydrogenase